MTLFDLQLALTNLSVVGKVSLLTVLDWVLGVLLALRAAQFSFRELPATLKQWATELLGLAVIGTLAGLKLTFADFDASVVLMGAFVALSVAYGAKIIAQIKDKITALVTPQAARAYFAKKTVKVEVPVSATMTVTAPSSATVKEQGGTL